MLDFKVLLLVFKQSLQTGKCYEATKLIIVLIVLSHLKTVLRSIQREIHSAIAKIKAG